MNIPLEFFPKEKFEIEISSKIEILSGNYIIWADSLIDALYILTRSINNMEKRYE